MGPNEQNQHFAELRQKRSLHIYIVVLLTCLPSLDGKLERFVTKSGKSDCQTRVRQTIRLFFFLSFFLSSLLQFLESHCFVRSWVSLCSILSLIASVALLMLSVSSLYRSLIFSLLLMCLYSSHVVM